MRVTPKLAMGLMGALVLIGCFGNGQSATSGNDELAPAEVSWLERALVFPEDHDHKLAQDHVGLSSNNMEVLGWSPLSSPYYDGVTMPGYSCAVTNHGTDTYSDDSMFLYTISYASDIAFTVINVTNASRPTWVSEFILPNAHSDDVRITPDGRYVIFGSEQSQGGDGPSGEAPVPGSVRRFNDACRTEILAPSEPAPADDHVYVVDVSDPTHPAYATSVKIPHVSVFNPNGLTGPHMVKVAEIDGRVYIFAFVAFPTIAYPHPMGGLASGGYGTSRVYIYELVEETGSVALELTTAYSVTPRLPPDPTALQILHDGWIQQHPVTKEHLLYIAAWDDGLVIVNVDDPSRPVEVGRWTDYEAFDAYESTGNMHHVVPIEGLWDGRHYVMTGPENFQQPPDAPTAWNYVVDTTDPTAPRMVGKWRLPTDPDPGRGWESPFLFSPHFFRFSGHHLVMAHFHGGAWVLDLSDPTAPREVGVFIPDHIPDQVYESRRVLNFLPGVVDVEVDEDAMYVMDWQSGVYAVRMNPEWAP